MACRQQAVSLRWMQVMICSIQQLSATLQPVGWNLLSALYLSSEHYSNYREAAEYTQETPTCIGC